MWRQLFFQKIRLILSGDIANYNLGELKNTLMIASSQLGDGIITPYPKLEVRGFVLRDDSKLKDRVQNRINAVINWLKYPSGKYINDEERFSLLSDYYTNKKLQPKQMSENIEPILISGDLKENSTYKRLPKEEVFNLMGKDSKMISSLIEIVLIFEEIK
jgi:hypothetical protein